MANGNDSVVIREEVKKFAEAMEIELIENAHKGSWKDCELRFLIAKLQEEVEELVLAANGCKLIEPKPEICDLAVSAQRNHVRQEAADVGNIAMMIADVCNGL